MRYIVFYNGSNVVRVFDSFSAAYDFARSLKVRYYIQEVSR